MLWAGEFVDVWGTRILILRVSKKKNKKKKIVVVLKVREDDVGNKRKG